MALWTPSRITTTLWLDASDASTLYDATSGGSLVAANGTIARWQDKSGNARHVTQATSGSRPLRKTATKNSLDIARFDGTDDLLETTFAAFGTSYAIVAVAMSSNHASGLATVIGCRSKTLGLPINPQVTNNTGATQFGVRDDTGSINLNSISGGANSVWYLWGGDRSGNNVTTYRDGSPGTLGTNSIGTVTTNVTSVGGLYTGTSTPNTFLNGDIAEIVVCGTADRVITEGYLAWKWGIQANLPSGHTYLSAAPTVPSYRYPSLRTTAPVASYYAWLDAGAAATDQFTADGSQDGTLTNGATRSGSPLAYSFDGTDDLITIASGFISAFPFAISCWFNTSNATASFRSFASLGNSGNTTNHVSFGFTTTHNLRWNPRTAGTDAVVDSPLTYNDGVWHHAIGVSESATSHKLYVDGSLVASSATNIGGVPTVNQAAIGCLRRSTNASFFPGLVDDALFLLYSPSLTDIAYLASQRGAIYQLLAGSSPINGQSLIRPADSKPYQQLIGA